MSLISRMRKQKAVWWERGTADKFGRFSFAAPVEISCRWDDSTEEFRNLQGQLQGSRAVVYTDRVVKQGDILKKGSLESGTPDDPRDTTNTYEVQRFDETPNLRATEFLYTAYVT